MSSRKRLYYAGVRMAPYDLVKEAVLATAAMTVLIALIAAIFSSPDVAPVTLRSMAQSDPQGYVQAVLNDLDGNSDISSYGPPYNNGTDSVQTIGPIHLQSWFGVRIPVNPAQDYVIDPLTRASATSPGMSSALHRYMAAPPTQQSSWTSAYDTALAKASVSQTSLQVAACACGPVSSMMAASLRLGQSGAMDGLLLTTPGFYGTDYTRPLLFMQNDSVAAKAQGLNLLGSQWGVMNETGNYPGQAWLWLYTMLYQIAPFTTTWAANADAMALLTVSLLSTIMLLIPWIPGLNRLPRYLGVYRLIWRDYYREVETRATDAAA
jgi:hypothetical protein